MAMWPPCWRMATSAPIRRCRWYSRTPATWTMATRARASTTQRPTPNTPARRLWPLLQPAPARHTSSTHPRLRPVQALEAAGYIRVSLERQAEGYSPDVQRDAIKRLAAEQGYALTLIEEDHERGSKVSRQGYQRIIEAVRQGTIHAVLVFMFDRWGRDGAEWLTRAREFERLGVPIISAQEGRDEGGLIRFVRAGMAEEYSRQLAKRVLPAREKAAREGTYMGPTPP